MYRTPLDNYNTNQDIKPTSCQTTRNQEARYQQNFSIQKSSRASSFRNGNIKNQFDIICFLMSIEIERLNQENEKLKQSKYENKEPNFEMRNLELQLKEISERLVKKELQCQKLENQLSELNKMIAQKELLLQNSYQQMTQQVSLIHQLKNNIKQLECKIGFLVCENENLNIQQKDGVSNFQNQQISLQKEHEQLQLVYSSLLENYNIQNDKLKQSERMIKELEDNLQLVNKQHQQQENENKNKMIQYLDCRQKLIFITTEVDRVNELLKQKDQDFEKKIKRLESISQTQGMRIILHCAEIERLIEVQGKLMNENQWYRNQIELYALMMQEKNEKQGIHLLNQQQIQQSKINFFENKKFD